MTLSVLTVTRNELHARPFLEFHARFADLLTAEHIIYHDIRPAGGVLEEIYDQAIAETTGDWILRLDDDETVTLAMLDWLQEFLRPSAALVTAWSFPRAHLWGDERHFLRTPTLYPDAQTRLTRREVAGRIATLPHAGSVSGPGHRAPAMIAHHKFLVRSLKDRLAIQENYDRRLPDYAERMLPFAAPELAYVGQTIELAELGDGSTDGWRKSRMITL